MTHTTQVPAQFRIIGALSMSGDKDSRRRFSMEVYDGGKLHIAGSKYPVVIDLSSVTTAPQIKALLHHDTLKPVGHFETFQIGDSIRGEGVLSQENDAKREVVEAQKNGFEWESSIGAQHDPAVAKFIGFGKSVRVNNRDLSGPFILARNAHIREASFVGAGGGENTSATIAAAWKWSDPSMSTTLTAGGDFGTKLNELIAAKVSGEGDTSALLDLMAEAAGIERSALEAIIKGESNATKEQAESFAKTLEAEAESLTSLVSPPAESKPATTETNSETQETTDMTTQVTNENNPPVDGKIAAGLHVEMKSLQDQMAAMNARQRVDELAAQYGLQGEAASKIKANAVTNKWDDREIELQILRASRSSAANVATLDGKDGAPLTQDVINASLCLSMGLDEEFVGKEYGEKTTNEIIEGNWRRIGIHGLYHEYLRAHGYHVVGGVLSEADFQHANRLASREDIQAAGGFSTFSLPRALGDFTNKDLLRSFNAVRRAARSIAYRTMSTNFQPIQMFRLSLAGGGLKRVGPNGQLESVDLVEDGASVKVGQWGNKLTIGFQDIRNGGQNLRTFNQQFGAFAALTVEVEGVTALLSNPTLADGNPFFSTARGNRITGAGTALGIDGVTQGNEAFLSLRTPEGVEATLDPANLLTGPSGDALARQMHSSTAIVAAGSADRTLPQDNPWRGMFNPVMSRHLTNGRVPNATGVQWFLTCDSSLSGPIAVAYLDGIEAPSIKTWDSIPGHTGMQTDVVLNFGVGPNDPYSAIMSDGA